ncbi:replication initiation protein [Actinomadura graeca]|uniref:Replication initiation protein n=1 Tax=Actinomadura graeca TaxID=2750812 RepID=A0ABX8R4M1_9ACTN|nr:replication initiator [Actinomadura graeca]QXJ25985.1 replication initiation protein [Actinomadura graeca]
MSDIIGPVLRDLTRRSGTDLQRWIDQVNALRGCAEPVRLSGESMTLNATTGEVLSSYTTQGEPHGQLMVRCKNRRASRCPSCAEEYRADTYHLIKAGLCGGDKGVPVSVGSHPRVLATLTAPTFGAVHRGPDKAGRVRVCHPRRNGPACWRRHGSDDELIGQPLQPDAYDYAGHVVWNAHAGELWRRFTTYLRRHLAAAAGMTQRAFNQSVKVSFAKVAEYQARGLVHFHAVIRLDGRADGPDAWPAPPCWATPGLLDAAIGSAAAAVRLDVEVPSLGRAFRLGFGEQVDVQSIAAFGDGCEISDQAVAGYVAKYATKAAESTGTLDRRVNGDDLAGLAERGVTRHAARLIRTCWHLGDIAAHPELADAKLRKWAHMLGFRGHFTTKSRGYSTTLGTLRGVRAEYTRRRLGRPDPTDETILVVAHWRYLGQGYTAAERQLVETVTGPSPGQGERRPSP